MRTAPTTEARGSTAPRIRTPHGTAERALEIGLAYAQSHHGDLGGRERDEHPEAVEARQELGPVADGVGDDEQEPAIRVAARVAAAVGAAPRSGRAKAWGSIS